MRSATLRVVIALCAAAAAGEETLPETAPPVLPLSISGEQVATWQPLGIRLASGEELVAPLISAEAGFDAQGVGRGSCRWADGVALAVEHRAVTLAGLPVLERTLTVSSAGSGEAHVLLSFPITLTREASPQVFVPGHICVTNNVRGGFDVFPKVVPGGEPGVPNSSAFRLRADRSSTSSVMLRAPGALLAMATDEGSWIDETSRRFAYHGLGFNFSRGASPSVELTVGYENWPARYNGNTFFIPRWTDGPLTFPVRLAGGEAITLCQWIAVLPDADGRAWARAQRAFYEALHDEPQSLWIEPPRAMTLVSTSIVRDMWVERCGLFRAFDFAEVCDSGWTGGMMVAWPLARVGRELGDARLVEIAVGAADRLCSEGFHEEAQMFWDTWLPDEGWSADAWWSLRQPDSHIAYISGQSALMLLRMWEDLPEDERAAHTQWVERARQVVEHGLSHQREDGAIPAHYNRDDGSPHPREGYAGCWIAAAAAKLADVTREARFREGADRALGFYHRWARTLEVWGTPVDASDAPDSEGPLALAALAAELHRQTGEARHLEALLDALDLEFSWQWAYDTHSESEPLASLGWHSTGGAAASACNIHLAQMNALIAPEMAYAAQVTGDAHLASRLRDAVAFSLGTVNRVDGEFGFGLQGMVTEQFFHTDAVQGAMGADGGILPYNLVWPQACVLIAALWADDAGWDR